MTRVTDDGLN
jgi:hypothetical protein